MAPATTKVRGPPPDGSSVPLTPSRAPPGFRDDSAAAASPAGSGDEAGDADDNRFKLVVRAHFETENRRNSCVLSSRRRGLRRGVLLPLGFRRGRDLASAPRHWCRAHPVVHSCQGL